MTFSDFARRIGSVLRGADSQAAFTKTLFEMIIPDDRDDLLEGISDSTWKSYFNGGAQITRLAKKINAFADPMLFEPYIDEQEEPAIQKLCDAFTDVLPEINLHNAGEQIAALFDGIINESAGGKKEKPINSDKESNMLQQKNGSQPGSYTVPTEPGDYALNLALETGQGTYRISEKPEIDPFQEYIDKAAAYYSQKKTLLYTEIPRPFYSMYVCNDLRCRRFPGARGNRLDTKKSDATVSSLEKNSKYNIIQGAGGIGKSMFMTHLFLSSATEYHAGKKLPVLILLKDYKENFPDLTTFILQALNDFDQEIEREKLIEKLKHGQIILLLDGLDEIQSQLKESFDKNLESFIKGYSANSVFMTSRPITEFIAYSQFTLYDIEPLRMEQAIEVVQKLEFWDEEAKKNFIIDLEKGLFRSHEQFASNPLLLTIMLMTYSIHGDIPEKMHTFYAKAYETMARLHDATKGSFKRPLYTGLTPERFAEYFSQFCARTFVKEQLEFTKDEFVQQMKKVIENVPVHTSEEKASLQPTDFLRDLTDNLCILYCEGEKYYFIHRSFQEYFAALYFVNDEEDLVKAGEFFDQKEGMFFQRVIDMMYDMAEDKVERFVFFPYLERMFSECAGASRDMYWGLLIKQYPLIYYNDGEVDDPDCTIPESLVYSAILKHKKLAKYNMLDDYSWHEAVNTDPLTEWVRAYSDYLDDDSYDPDEAREKVEIAGADSRLVRERSLPLKYRLTFDDPDIVGTTYLICVEELLKNPNENQDLIHSMMDEKFPLFIEYQSIRQYYAELKARVEKKRKAKGLFDD